MFNITIVNYNYFTKKKNNYAIHLKVEPYLIKNSTYVKKILKYQKGYIYIYLLLLSLTTKNINNSSSLYKSKPVSFFP